MISSDIRSASLGDQGLLVVFPGMASLAVSHWNSLRHRDQEDSRRPGTRVRDNNRYHPSNAYMEDCTLRLYEPVECLDHVFFKS
jgi:hypothetical protein